MTYEMNNCQLYNPRTQEQINWASNRYSVKTPKRWLNKKYRVFVPVHRALKFSAGRKKVKISYKQARISKESRSG